MRKLLVICILPVILAGCTFFTTDRYDLNVHINVEESHVYYSPNKSHIIGDALYYVNPLDGLVYVTDIELKEHKKIVEEPITLFAVTDQNIVCIRNDNKSAIYSLDGVLKNEIEWDPSQYMRVPQGFSYCPNGYSIIYNDRIVYINDNEELVSIDYYGNSELLAGKALLIEPYKKSIFYLTENNHILDSNTMKVIMIDGKNDMEVFRDYVFSFEIYDDWIYFIHDYSLYRSNIISGGKEIVVQDSGIFNFNLLNSTVVCCRQNDLIYCDLDGANIHVLESNSNIDILAADNNLVVYQAEDSYIGIFDLISNQLSKIIVQADCLNCVVIGDVIYLAFGYYDGEPIYLCGGFYNKSGELIYSFEDNDSQYTNN